MFSNLTSYIFGGSEESPNPDASVQGQAVPPHAQTSPRGSNSDDEWVVVGGGAPNLHLGPLNGPPLPATGSTGSSETPSETDVMVESDNAGGDGLVLVEMDDTPYRRRVSADDPSGDGHQRRDVALTRTGRRLATPFGSIPGQAAATVATVKTLRSAQSLKVKEAGKPLSGKALERRNKAVRHPGNHHHGGGHKKNKGATMALRSAGCARQLKQC